MSLSRRGFMKAGIIGSIGVAGAKSLANACGLTPPQTEGPFYPERDQSDKDNDLTMVRGRSGVAEGEKILIVGKVVDQYCRPVEGALVEIWQACSTGKYNHSSDPNTAQLDPNFQYWGQDVSDEEGSYEFLSIKPGHYPASHNWIRPPHIHFKVHKRGYKELTSQLYFKGDRYNSTDKILNSIPPPERERVIVDFQPTEHRSEIVLMAEFDISIEAL